jgi:hypothetical protein
MFGCWQQALIGMFLVKRETALQSPAPENAWLKDKSQRAIISVTPTLPTKSACPEQDNPTALVERSRSSHQPKEGTDLIHE